MLKLAAVLFLAHFAAGQRVININNETDVALAKVNAHLSKAGLGLRKLPDVSYPEVKLSNGAQVGLNSYYRIGDSFMKIIDDRTQSVDLHVGFGLLGLAYGSIVSGGIEMSGGFLVRNNSFHVSYTVVTRPHCKVTLGDYQFDFMTTVSFASSIPKQSGDVSDIFSKYVVPRVNERISHLRRKVQRRFQKVICHRHLENANLNSHQLSEILESLEYLY